MERGRLRDGEQKKRDDGKGGKGVKNEQTNGKRTLERNKWNEKGRGKCK